MNTYQKITTHGTQGEDYCEKWLKHKGYEILERNYHSRFGEIDIIARIDDTLVFVEVKARETDGRMLPREAVDAAKQRKIIRTAYKYIAEKSADIGARFDVMEVYFEDDRPTRLTHIKNAFEPTGEEIDEIF